MLILDLLYGRLPVREPQYGNVIIPPVIESGGLNEPNPIFDSFHDEMKVLADKHKIKSFIICAGVEKNGDGNVPLSSFVQGEPIDLALMAQALGKHVTNELNEAAAGR